MANLKCIHIFLVIYYKIYKYKSIMYSVHTIVYLYTYTHMYHVFIRIYLWIPLEINVFRNKVYDLVKNFKYTLNLKTLFFIISIEFHYFWCSLEIAKLTFVDQNIIIEEVILTISAHVSRVFSNICIYFFFDICTKRIKWVHFEKWKTLQVQKWQSNFR